MSQSYNPCTKTSESRHHLRVPKVPRKKNPQYPVDGDPANPHTGAPPGGSPGGARPGPGPHKMYGGDGGGRFLADLVRKWTRLFIFGDFRL